MKNTKTVSLFLFSLLFITLSSFQNTYNWQLKKFENDIKKSFEEARELLKSCEMEMDTSLSEKHANALDTLEKERLEMINIFLENNFIRTFLEEERPKHREEQLGKRKIKEEKFSKQN